jgi:hypothetical protein
VQQLPLFVLPPVPLPLSIIPGSPPAKFFTAATMSPLRKYQFSGIEVTPEKFSFYDIYYLHLGMNKNCSHEEIKSKLKSGNACCHSAQNLLNKISLKPAITHL